MSLTFIDTHTHLYTEEFDTDRDEVVARAVAAGARHLLLPNIDANSVGPMLALCDAYPDLCRPMMGLHPTELPPDPAPLLEQMDVFRRQVEWSLRFDLPLVIHTRSAHSELLEVLTPFKADLKRGIFHCFGGNAKEASELLSFEGFALGIGGVVTFKKSTLPAVLETTVPLDRIVLETDAPYLAPTPYRGQRNEPAHLPLVIHRLAEIYQTTPEHIAQVTTQTAERIFQR